jgi:ribonucleoside-triphosphate reductase
MKYIIKRDGRKKKFDREKIVNAIMNAFETTDGAIKDEHDREYALAKANNIADYIEDVNNKSDKMLDVEHIQDLVENGLMACKKKDVAREYIKYRAKRSELRSKRSEFNKIIGEKLTASNVQNNNANMDEYSFGGRMGEAGSELAKKYALENVVSKKFADLHNNNICYIHDLNSVAIGSHNCLTIPIDDLLKNGFDTRQQTIREATTVSSALQLIAVIMQCQSLVQFGGVSASHLDWTLVPYVRKSFSKHMKDGLRYIEKCDDEAHINSMPRELPFDDGEANAHKEAYKYAMDMTKREVYQAVEGFLHNMNSLQSRSGNQLKKLADAIVR